ncbi:tyrosine-type recombinase/integrase [Pseudomonas fluorescens]|uniref:tyrosine-type recombinase/integrase n=1 Tax=Pseudomonas fluorescens TaxID=294 RepID=UPI002ACA2E34|nr:tyrosine-type recombinase/integrase [Pseudomonas fluorescens]MDZ5436774.1 tyrosine-type recombinase/integrase [Pseudomonas fluorescens]
MKLAGGSQLFTILPKLQIYKYHIAGKTYTKEANNLPFLVWPNGEPCTPANMYMLTLRDAPNKRGGTLSRRGKKGGTIGDYAAKISQLIRFCYQKRKNFLELSDSDFSDFMSEIKTQLFKNHIRQRQKNSETVNKTGQTCLRFLQHLGNFANRPNFVAPFGTINISYRISTRIGKNGKIYKQESIYHHSFSAGGDAGDPRNPISDASIQALTDAVDAAKTSTFIKFRRHLQLLFLEHSGPRRGELADLTVSAIFRASNMGQNPMLEMTTLKKGIPSTRMVPVSRMLLREAKHYIKFKRPLIIRKFTNSGRPDHDFLFISETTGKPLAETTTTNEINTLARLANIDEKACPHMFRHAFCTNLFVQLYERHRFKTDKDFEIRLLTDESFLQEILQYTGQGSIDSLRTYLKSAYRRINKIPETVSTVQILMLNQQFDNLLLALVKQLENGLPVDSFATQVRELVESKNRDFSNKRPGSCA